MRLRCLKNHGAQLGPCSGGYFFTNRTRWSLEIGQLYEAFGLGLWSNALLVLVTNNHGRARWFPLALFEVIDGSLPTGWEVAVYDLQGAMGFPPQEGWGGGHWVARFGYEELVTSDEHNDALMENDAAAVEVFERERRRLDGD